MGIILIKYIEVMNVRRNMRKNFEQLIKENKRELLNNKEEIDKIEDRILERLTTNNKKAQ
jgi:adenylyl- and sulfurtransferase ThiI